MRVKGCVNRRVCVDSVRLVCGCKNTCAVDVLDMMKHCLNAYTEGEDNPPAAPYMHWCQVRVCVCVFVRVRAWVCLNDLVGD